MPKSKTTSRSLSARTCKQITDLMMDYMNDKLRTKVKRAFEKHLEIWPDCVSFVNTYKTTVKSTATLRTEEIPPKVRDNILDFLRKKLCRVTAILISFFAHLAA